MHGRRGVRASTHGMHSTQGACRADLCGGRLHDICEAEDPDGGNEMHRICHSCVAKKVEAARGRSSATKRKDQEGFLQEDASKKKKSSARTSLARGSVLGRN